MTPGAQAPAGPAAGDASRSPSRAGTLWVVGTPIGNLGDLPPRAVGALEAVDIICCEDTRRTRGLLSASGVTGRGRLVSLHAHNEQTRIPQVLAHLAAGRDVALVTDAGMPGISDPGGPVVAAAVSAGYPVTAVPGPSAALTALVLSGLPSERFCMEGFLPRSGAERRRRLEALAAEERTTVLFESPLRLAQTLGDLRAVCGDDRPVAVARELTKLHEEVFHGPLNAAAEAFAGPVRGEIVVVVGGAAPPAAVGVGEVGAAVAAQLAGGATPRAAADAVSAALGVPRRQAYAMAIAQRDAAVG